MYTHTSSFITLQYLKFQPSQLYLYAWLVFIYTFPGCIYNHFTTHSCICSKRWTIAEENSIFLKFTGIAQADNSNNTTSYERAFDRVQSADHDCCLSHARQTNTTPHDRGGEDDRHFMPLDIPSVQIPDVRDKLYYDANENNLIVQCENQQKIATTLVSYELFLGFLGTCRILTDNHECRLNLLYQLKTWFS